MLCREEPAPQPAALRAHLQGEELVAGAGVEGGHGLAEGLGPAGLGIARLGGLRGSAQGCALLGGTAQRGSTDAILHAEHSSTWVQAWVQLQLTWRSNER